MLLTTSNNKPRQIVLLSVLAVARHNTEMQCSTNTAVVYISPELLIEEGRL